MGIWQWIVDTLRSYPELAIFLALAVGFWIGPMKLGGFSLGNVTATLLAAVAIGQLDIAVPGPIKSTFFLMFLFAVGYGVGPQFFRGLSTGRAEADPVLGDRAGVVPADAVRVRDDRGARHGLRGRPVFRLQTISASIGVASDQIDAARAARRAGQGVR